MNQSLRLKHFYVRNKPGLILAAAFLLYFWAVLLPPPRNTLAAGSGILVTWILSGILINASPFVAALALLYLVFRFSTTYYYANAPADALHASITLSSAQLGIGLLVLRLVLIAANTIPRKRSVA